MGHGRLGIQGLGQEEEGGGDEGRRELGALAVLQDGRA